MRTYNELSLEERVEMQQRLESGESLRAVGPSSGRSPRTISRDTGTRFPGAASYRVTRESIYSAVYLVHCGELRKELIGCLRKGRSTRKLRTRSADRRGQIPDMQSIHVRPRRSKIA